MTLTIDLPPEVEQKLGARAAAAGQDVSGYVQQLIRQDIERLPTFDEICAPFARAVEASGMSDEELEQFFKEVREEVWQEKHGKLS